MTTMRIAALAAAVLVAVTCASTKNASDGDAATAGKGDRPRPAAPAAATCSGIRLCIYQCKADKACAQACAETAAAPAHTKFASLETCSRKACPMQDTDCRCQAECFVPGPCETEYDACTESMPDPFCDELCH
jgi:hypothetical protein